MPQRPQIHRPRHARATARQYERDRGTAHERGYDARWRKYRKWFLRENPLCVLCLKQGRTEPATVVDHVRPHKGDDELFWDAENHQALCKRCHDAKTAREERQAWR